MDDDLIAAVAAGDDGALRDLFFRHAPWLAARLRPALSAADVEDVLQETFLAVWRGAGSYRPAGNAGGWLWALRAWLHVVSRRVPAALCLLAALGAILAVALHWHWSIAGGPAARQVVPLVIESRAAAVIATATYGPPGESERAAGR